jgi:hypothetical protein
MQESAAQMALRLHQRTGEPLAHCMYLLEQTNGNYDTALKFLERILEQRQAGIQGTQVADAPSSTPPMAQQEPQTLEQRVAQLESQFAQLTLLLSAMSDQLTVLLDKISDTDTDL